MLDGLERRERYTLIGGLALVAIAAFGIGAAFTGTTSSTDTVGVGDAVASDTVKQKVQSFMDQQLDQQRQQFSLIAQQSPNISADDLAIDATVTGVSGSQFGSLQKVTVSITGTVPARTGGLQQLDREQTLYVSQDGQFLFQQPTNLDQPRQQPPLQQGQ